MERLSYLDSLKAVILDRRYARRLAVLIPMWFFGYMTVYVLAAGLTTILASLGYPPPEAGIIASFGDIGFILCALTIILVGDKMERSRWTAISVLFTIVGGVVIALAKTNLPLSFLGSSILFYGFNLWVPVSYAWSAESFPTRARATGFALTDGLGHIGGGVGTVVVASFVASLVSSGVTTGLAIEVFLLIASFQIISTVIAVSLGHKTANKRLDEISP